MRFLLYPFSLLYSGITGLRNYLYNSGFFSSVTFDRPVISVGNMSTGGTGKTPHIEYLVRMLQSRYTVATLSRGYKRTTGGFVCADDTADARTIGDEPMQFHRKFPELVVCVAEERVTGIPDLLTQRPDVDVVLLDDAYQHRTVKPGLNVLLTEYDAPFYRDHVLPVGRLREPRGGYRRADVIVVSKCPPEMTQREMDVVVQKIKPAQHQQVFFSFLTYGEPYELLTAAPFSYSGQTVLLVCGIAKPTPLIRYMSAFAENVQVLTFPDHHYYTTSDLEKIRTSVRGLSGQAVIYTTEKDAQRLLLHRDFWVQESLTVVVLPVTVSFLPETDAFQDRVQQYLDSVAQEKGDIN